MSTRNSKFPFIVSALSAAIMVSACGGDGSLGGGDTAGIGGSGFISSGTVTGFGSVYVNGVRFETDSSTIYEIEDANRSQGDLRVGMVVQVEGSITSDSTGIATGIQYSDDIEGPISSVSGTVDDPERTLIILGKTVIISATDTAYEGFTYADIAQGNLIEVSGFEDRSGTLRASYIELKSTISNESSIVEIKGLINIAGADITVQGITINVDAVNLDGLQSGSLVEVKGTYDSNTITITATEIEAESNDLSDDADKVELEGLITRYGSNSDFDINGITVNATNASFTPLTPNLKEGDKVEAEGSMLNGVLIALKVEVRGGNAEVSATVLTPPPFPSTLNDSFTVSVAGQTVTVQLTTATRMEDDASTDDFLDPNNLVDGDFVEVRGFEIDTNPNTIIATQVKRESVEKDTELQGVITAQDEDATITVLGVAFPVDTNTEYKAADESQIGDGSHSDFISETSSGTVVVKIEDKKVFDRNDVGIADSVEIED